VRAFARTFGDSAPTADSASGGFSRQFPRLPVTPAVGRLVEPDAFHLLKLGYKMNLPENQTTNQMKKHNTETSVYNVDKLTNIATQAKILAWLILVISIAFFVVSIIASLMDLFSIYGSSYGISDLLLFLLSIFPSLIGLFLYIILLFVAECSVLLTKIKVNFRELNDNQK
jgi:ABC-type multidrug transport system fused ATPase/permease subunit